MPRGLSERTPRRDHVWDNFSSEDYKKLAPPDEVEFYNPFNEAQPIKFKAATKETGPGYYRVPSLVSLWSSAPFLHNNSLGKFTGDPSVAGRMDAFNDAAEKLLWPEKRLGKDSIWRTQEECKLQLRKEYLPEALRVLADSDGYVRGRSGSERHSDQSSRQSRTWILFKR